MLKLTLLSIAIFSASLMAEVPENSCMQHDGYLCQAAVRAIETVDSGQDKCGIQDYQCGALARAMKSVESGSNECRSSNIDSYCHTYLNAFLSVKENKDYCGNFDSGRCQSMVRALNNNCMGIDGGFCEAMIRSGLPQFMLGTDRLLPPTALTF